MVTLASHWALRASGQCGIIWGVHSGAGNGVVIGVDVKDVEGIAGTDGVDPGQGCALESAVFFRCPPWVVVRVIVWHDVDTASRPSLLDLLVTWLAISERLTAMCVVCWYCEWAMRV